MKKQIIRFLLIAGLAVFNVSAMPSGQAENVQLIEAASKGDAAKVQSLLAQGAKVNYRREGDDATALIMASQNGHTEVVKILLKKDMTEKNYKGDKIDD